MDKDGNLEHKELVCTCQYVGRTYTIDSTGVMKLEDQNELHVSSKGDEVSEINETSTLTKVALVHASELRADKSEGCNDIADNLKIEELVGSCKSAVATANIVDYADILKSKNAKESCISSSKGDELSENKKSSIPTEVASMQALAPRGKISEGCNDIADNLENRDLVYTCETAAASSADVLEVENGNVSRTSSFKGDELSKKKEYSTPSVVSFIQNSLSRTDRHENCNDGAHNAENGKLVCTCKIAEELTVTVDSGDALKVENGNELWAVEDGLSKNEEPSISTEVALVQASLSREDRIEDQNAIIDNQKGKAKANYGGEPKLYFETGSNYRMRYRAPRYFDPPEYSQWPCYEIGGDSYSHKKVKRKKRNSCYNCGDIGHAGPSCKNVKACIICLEKGHLIKDCPQRNMEVDASTLCLRCGNKGHEMFTCSSDYSPDDLKHIQCYVCKDFGHLCCVDYKMDGPTEASCYKCGLLGHSGLDCASTEVPITLAHGTLTKVPIPPEVPITEEHETLCPMCRESGMSKPGCRECKKARKRARKAEEQKTFCNVCRESGWAKPGCRQCKKARKTATRKKMKAERVAAAAASAKVKKSRKTPHRMKNLMPMPTVTPYPIPFSVRWQPPPIVGPYYGRPGSNVWLSPAAAARPPTWQMQPQPWNHQQVTQTSQHPLLYQQTVVPVPQSQTQVSSGPSTCFPQFL